MACLGTGVTVHTCVGVVAFGGRRGRRRRGRQLAPHCTALHSGLRCRYGLLACLLLVRGDLHTALPFYNTARWLNLVYAIYYCCWMESCTQCLSVSSRALRSAVYLPASELPLLINQGMAQSYASHLFNRSYAI